MPRHNISAISEMGMFFLMVCCALGLTILGQWYEKVAVRSLKTCKQRALRFFFYSLKHGGHTFSLRLRISLLFSVY